MTAVRSYDINGYTHIFIHFPHWLWIERVILAIENQVDQLSYKRLYVDKNTVT